VPIQALAESITVNHFPTPCLRRSNQTEGGLKSSIESVAVVPSNSSDFTISRSRWRVNLVKQSTSYEVEPEVAS
jgi:hypothetical protein